jgi:2-oxoglutarate dehydrogenase E2 component (dihydrolipoamide succinyltransferase)
MAIELTVPALGESITEAVVGKWHKKVGDPVKIDEAVVVLETDKVTIDVAAPASGALSSITHAEGDHVKIGDVLGTIASGAGAEVVRPGPAAPPPALPAPARPPASAPEPALTSAGGNGRQQPPLSPVARKIAEDAGLDPGSLRGSGASGRVTKDDVLTLLEGGKSASPTPPARASSVAAAASAPAAPRPSGAREERVKMTPLRKRVAERLLAAQSSAAILTTFNEVDMGEVMALRKTYGERFLARHGTKLGFMGFFVRAVVDALKAFPLVNSEIDGEDIVLKRYYDIGVAVSGTRGLVVPVLRDADTLSMGDIEKRIAELGTRARTDKLTLAELQGGTFTISNGGIFGSMLSTPILNPPQTAILGMHNIVDRPVARDGQVVIRPVMYLALSYDHRLIDGREAVQFLVRIKECIEDPERLLLEV